MKRLTGSLFLLTLAAIPVGAAPAKAPKSTVAKPQPKPAVVSLPPDVISEGKEAILVDSLRPEGPTVVLFYRPMSEAEQDLADFLRKRVQEDPRVGLRFVRLSSTDAPIAKQYEVEKTPAAFVYDRNKNLLGRAESHTEIGELVGKGLKVARIKWLDEGDPTAPEAYRKFGGGARPVPEIMKTLSLRPEIMEAINDLSRYHFSDGFLDRRTHEMVASYVSAVNKCKY